MDTQSPDNNLTQGGSLSDLVSTQKGGVNTLAVVAKSIVNFMPPATASTSPTVTPINNLSTATSSLVAVNTFRHGIMFHNPGTTTCYVFPSILTASTNSTTLGGAFVVYPGGTLQFSPSTFPNVNCAWSGFASSGSSQSLTVVEFY